MQAAAGKVRVSHMRAGVRVMVTMGGDGKWYPSRTRVRDAHVATVVVDPAPIGNGRRRITASVPRVEGLVTMECVGHQTFWSAPPAS